MVFHFCNTFLNLPNILSLFSGKIIISSTSSCLSILPSFDFVTTYAILFPKYSPALWTTFLEACILYSIIVFYIFLQMIKIHIV